jgi:hypothetical protein
MARHQTAGPKRPLGLKLLSALLLIVALRGVGWIVIGGLVARRTPGLAGWLPSLLVTAVLLASAVGLLRLREWARWLTLAVCSVYFGLTLVNVGVLWPRLRASRVNLNLGALNAAEAVIVQASAWWYLNRKDVRRLFRDRG